jgi:hypothetical protein
MIITNVVEDDIRAVVASVQGTIGANAWDFTTGSTSPNFMTGHPLEIANRLTLKNSNPSQANNKYPLIALKLDIVARTAGDMLEYNLNIVIAAFTSKDLTSEQRLEQTFRPKLIPLYNAFLGKLKTSGKFTWDRMLLTAPPHDMIRRYYYGTLTPQQSAKNLFHDPVDAIEIVDLRINSRIKTC